VKKEDGTPFWSGNTPYKPGTYDVLREGDDGAIIVMGTLTSDAVKAHHLIKDKSGKRFAVYGVASMKPFPADLVARACKTGRIITLEDHHVDTGLGRIVATQLADQGLACKLRRLGVHKYGTSGAPAELFQQMGLDAASVAEVAVNL
jgi:transketolase